MSSEIESSISPIRDYLLDLQANICNTIERLDGQASFETDEWRREEGGGGASKVLSAGAVFEKAGVNFSEVHGDEMPGSATAHRPALAGRAFRALGVSLVIHPDNPFVPTTHMNVRFFTAFNASSDPVWWFGGGFDLTPYYGFPEDARHFHEQAKHACDAFGEDVYPRYKKWCDEYFYLKHRDETRGIGGLFYDDLNEWPQERCFEFMQSVGDHFLPAYVPIVERRKDHPFTDDNKWFQQYRRGRYVEFNLVYDRGTLFGLQSNGRTESILMSLPAIARWEYDWRPTPGTAEADLYANYLRPRDWLNEQLL